MATALVAPPAWAGGGTGGDPFSAGSAGAGGLDSGSGAGSPGSSPTSAAAGAGGGGAGTDGGAGGSGIGVGGAGGTAGVGAGASGGAGGNGGNGSGGGGGGGGGAGLFSAGSTTTSTLIAGGTGGMGGTGNSGAGPSVGGGGGGGAGGNGAIVSSGTYTITASGIVFGGGGGAGGASNAATFTFGAGGSGGSGGAGLFLGSGATLNNAGVVGGGTGGAGGSPINGTGTPGVAGAGGAGVVGSGITIVNSGMISGGVNGLGSAASQPDAITFTGGANTLTLQAGSTINGNIGVTGSLNLSQSTTATLSNVITGSGSVEKSGAGTLTLSGTNTYSGGTTLTGGTLRVSSNANLGASTGGLTFNGGTLELTSSFNLAGTRAITLGAGGGTFNLSGNSIVSQGITGSGSLTKTGSSNLTLNGTNSYTGGTTIAQGTLSIGSGATTGKVVGAISVASTTTLLIVNADMSGVTSIANSGVVGFSGANSAGNVAITNSGGVFSFTQFSGTSTAGNATIINSGTNTETDFIGSSTAGNATLITNSGAFLGFGGTATGGQARAITNAGGIFDMSSLTSSGMTIGSIEGAGTYRLGRKQFTVGGNNLSTTLSGTIIDGGIAGGTGASLVKTGTGTLTLTGTNTYSGGTTVTGGLINFAALANFGTGMVTLNGGGVQWAAGTSTDISARLAPIGAGGAVFDTNGNNVTLASALSGTGGLTKQGLGTLTLGGANTYTGATTVNAGMLVVNGSLTGAVTLNNGSMLGGSGSIGTLVSNGGTLAPGNSVGTLGINGNFVQNGGTYVVEANAAGQSDRVNVSGTGTINGATVQVVAAAGNYGTSTTYTILNATGGVNGTYSGVSSNFAFLTPSLSYDANNVFLTLALQGNAFSGFGGNTVNQRAVGTALDQTYANASGDFATVIGALAGLSTSQASPALDAISGQQYADFGTTNVNGSAMFMNTLGQQMALARSGNAPGMRVALAQACEVEACDQSRPLSAWFSGLGGLGSVQGDGNSSTLTYNFGGAAAGIDYRLDPRFLVGVGVGYSHGTQWVNSLMGQGWTDSISVAAYGSFTQAGFYADALAGYAYFNNQMQRQIQIPGLQQRTASGSTGANQFLTQLETGYKLGLWEQAAMTLTPFGRLQFSTTSQNAFTESGANSLNLSVAQQTTNSLRTVFGAELGSSIGLANQRQLDLALRLGWQHEYASTARPVTAAFSGAPTASFTVYGATPTRDAAIVGLSAGTTVAEATQLYLRYDGMLGSGTDNHAITAGLRLSW